MRGYATYGTHHQAIHFSNYKTSTSLRPEFVFRGRVVGVFRWIGNSGSEHGGGRVSNLILPGWHGVVGWIELFELGGLWWEGGKGRGGASTPQAERLYGGISSTTTCRRRHDGMGEQLRHAQPVRSRCVDRNDLGHPPTEGKSGHQTRPSSIPWSRWPESKLSETTGAWREGVARKLATQPTDDGGVSD
jgi:hypothetical protein